MLSVAILIALVGVFLALPGAINQSIALWERRQAWRAGKSVAITPNASRGWSLTAFNLIGVGLLFLLAYKTWILPPEKMPLGFNPGWPDAIRCELELPEMRGPAPYIFYYLETQKGVQSLSDVARYFLIGGGDHAHELWFVADASKAFNKPLIRRVGNNGTNEPALEIMGSKPSNPIPPNQLDEYGKRYLQFFPDDSSHPLDCGGNTIEEIRLRGNAFYFAER